MSLFNTSPVGLGVKSVSTPRNKSVQSGFRPTGYVCVGQNYDQPATCPTTTTMALSLTAKTCMVCRGGGGCFALEAWQTIRLSYHFFTINTTQGYWPISRSGRGPHIIVRSVSLTARLSNKESVNQLLSHWPYIRQCTRDMWHIKLLQWRRSDSLGSRSLMDKYFSSEWYEKLSTNAFSRT